jgi:hypothetical protein
MIFLVVDSFFLSWIIAGLKSGQVRMSGRGALPGTLDRNDTPGEFWLLEALELLCALWVLVGAVKLLRYGWKNRRR